MLGKISWNSTGQQYHVDWHAVFIFTFLVLSARFAASLKAPWSFALPVAVLVVGGAYLVRLYVKSRNKISSEKIVFNLTIKIQCNKQKFEKSPLYSAEDQIERYGLAIHRAKEMLQGNWRVTDHGKLLRGFSKDVETHAAILEVDDAGAGLILLEKVLNKKAQFKKNSCMPHVHLDSGSVLNIWADENFMYID